MKDFIWGLTNSVRSFFRYFKYDHNGHFSIAGSIFAVAILVIIFGGLITVFLKYGVLILILIAPWLLSRVSGKSYKARNIVVLGLVLTVFAFFVISWWFAIIPWLFALIYAVVPEKFTPPEDGFF